MSSQNSVEEYCQRAQQYSTAKDKRAIQDWESFLTNFHKQDYALTVALTVCGSTPSSSSPCLLASQSLRFLCRKRYVDDTHLLALIDLTKRHCNGTIGTTTGTGGSSKAVITQLCLSLAASIVYRLISDLAKTDLAQRQNVVTHTLSHWLSVLHTHGLPLAIQIEILSVIPEHCGLKEIKGTGLIRERDGAEMIQSSILYGTPVVVSAIEPGLGTSSSSTTTTTTMKSLCEQLQEGELDEDMAIVYTKLLQCASNWMKYAITLSLPGGSQTISSQSSIAHLLIAVLSAWLGEPSDRQQQQEEKDTNSSRGLITGICQSIRLLGNMTILQDCEDSISTLLESLCHTLSTFTELAKDISHRILSDPTSVSMMSSMTALQSVLWYSNTRVPYEVSVLLQYTDTFFMQQMTQHNTNNYHSRYDIDITICLDYCRPILLLAQEIVSLSIPALTLLQAGGGTSSNERECVSSDERERLYADQALLSLSSSINQFTHNIVNYFLHVKATLHRNHIHRDCMLKFARDIITIVIPYWSDFPIYRSSLTGSIGKYARLLVCP